MRRTQLLLAGLVAAATAVQASPAVSLPAFTLPVTVGAAGNEPLVRSAPDGTLYVSALQHLYVSRDAGRHWKQSPGSVYSEQLNLASDSSIAVDAKGRLYQTFDYPYAGNTAVCTSDDRAQTFACNPVALPGGTDRMWLALLNDTTSFLVTNEGLYQTVYATSTDRGATYVPTQTATPLLDPTDGPLLVSPTTGAVVQPIIDNASNQSSTTNFESGTGLLRVYEEPESASIHTRPIPLTAGGALPGGAYDKGGALYVTSEKAVRSGGRIESVGVRVARSLDDGRTWSVLPVIPGTEQGTSTFVALGAGKPGHVGVVFYRTSKAGDPGSLPEGTVWDAVYAETHDARSARPHWSVTVLEHKVHKGVICATAGCVGSGRFAGDFLDTSFDSHDRPLIAYVRDNGAGTVVRFSGGQSVTSVPPPKVVPPVQVPPVVHPPGKSLASTGGTPLLAVLGLVLLLAARRAARGWRASPRSASGAGR